MREGDGLPPTLPVPVGDEVPVRVPLLEREREGVAEEERVLEPVRVEVRVSVIEKVMEGEEEAEGVGEGDGLIVGVGVGVQDGEGERVTLAVRDTVRESVREAVTDLGVEVAETETVPERVDADADREGDGVAARAGSTIHSTACVRMRSVREAGRAREGAMATRPLAPQPMTPSLTFCFQAPGGFLAVSRFLLLRFRLWPCGEAPSPPSSPSCVVPCCCLGAVCVCVPVCVCPRRSAACCCPGRSRWGWPPSFSAPASPPWSSLTHRYVKGDGLL